MPLTHAFLISVDPDAPAVASRLALRLGMPVRPIVGHDLRGRPVGTLHEVADLRAFQRRYGTNPTAGEVGCALAHRECWQILRREGGDTALVLEDDVELGVVRVADLDEIADALQPWDIISLQATYGVFERHPRALPAERIAHRATLSCFGAHAYLISRASADRLLRRQSPRVRHLADWPVEVWTLRLWAIQGGLLHFLDRASTLGPTDGAPAAARGFDRIVHWLRDVLFRVRRGARIHLAGDRVLSISPASLVGPPDTR